MKILFIGSTNRPKFLLKKCFELRLNIVGVCTQKSSINNDFYDLKKDKFIPNVYFDISP